MKYTNDFINYIMKMPYQKWWTFRLLQWSKYVKSHPVDKLGNTTDENNVPDWFMKSKEDYCSIIEQHQDKIDDHVDHEEFETLVSKFELALAEIKVRDLKEKLKE